MSEFICCVFLCLGQATRRWCQNRGTLAPLRNPMSHRSDCNLLICKYSLCSLCSRWNVVTLKNKATVLLFLTTLGAGFLHWERAKPPTLEDRILQRVHFYPANWFTSTDLISLSEQSKLRLSKFKCECMEATFHAFLYHYNFLQHKKILTTNRQQDNNYSSKKNM